ncbi:MAG TPA: DUF5615 family PIN-like protein [Candidatus Bathyarchaeia archaeon]|nr:DUF5615 family PIN-like protein [Candidatus Bathyarchaeia archaeon]
MNSNRAADKKPTLLLDEQVLGLDEFLRDLGWNTVKVKPGMTDDTVLSLARENGYVVISQDRKLLSRCRLQGIKMVDIGFEDLARRVHQILMRYFEEEH